MYVWVMSKAYTTVDYQELPVVYSYGRNFSCMGFEPNGWGLCWLSLDAHQLEFLRSGMDDRVEVVGKENDPPTQLLLDTYAAKLGSHDFQFTHQVLSKLGETEPRFIMERDPRQP